jgi:hypothetical protein
MKIRREDSVAQREERKEELRLQAVERERTSFVLQKIVDKLCPELDPTDKYAARKRKLDDSRAVLGEDLYNLKLKQLKEEFIKASAL